MEILPNKNLIEDIRTLLFYNKREASRLDVDITYEKVIDKFSSFRKKLPLVSIHPKKDNYYLVYNTSRPLAYGGQLEYPDNYIYVDISWAIRCKSKYGGDIYYSSYETQFNYVKTNEYDYIVKHCKDDWFSRKIINILINNYGKYMIISKEKYKSFIKFTSRSKDYYLKVVDTAEEAVFLSMATGGEISHLTNS